MRNRPLSAAEVQNYPEFPYITWDLKPNSMGKLSVAKNRGGPLDIAWEVHGKGENKMVVSVFLPLLSFCGLSIQQWLFHRNRIMRVCSMFDQFVTIVLCSQT